MESEFRTKLKSDNYKIDKELQEKIYSLLDPKLYSKEIEGLRVVMAYTYFLRKNSIEEHIKYLRNSEDINRQIVSNAEIAMALNMLTYNIYSVNGGILKEIALIGQRVFENNPLPEDEERLCQLFAQCMEEEVVKILKHYILNLQKKAEKESSFLPEEFKYLSNGFSIIEETKLQKCIKEQGIITLLMLKQAIVQVDKMIQDTACEIYIQKDIHSIEQPDVPSESLSKSARYKKILDDMYILQDHLLSVSYKKYSKEAAVENRNTLAAHFNAIYDELSSNSGYPPFLYTSANESLEKEYDLAKHYIESTEKRTKMKLFVKQAKDVIRRHIWDNYVFGVNSDMLLDKYNLPPIKMLQEVEQNAESVDLPDSHKEDSQNLGNAERKSHPMDKTHLKSAPESKHPQTDYMHRSRSKSLTEYPSTKKNFYLLMNTKNPNHEIENREECATSSQIVEDDLRRYSSTLSFSKSATDGSTVSVNSIDYLNFSLPIEYYKNPKKLSSFPSVSLDNIQEVEEPDADQQLEEEVGIAPKRISLYKRWSSYSNVSSSYVPRLPSIDETPENLPPQTATARNISIMSAGVDQSPPLSVQYRLVMFFLKKKTYRIIRAFKGIALFMCLFFLMNILIVYVRVLLLTEDIGFLSTIMGVFSSIILGVGISLYFHWVGQRVVTNIQYITILVTWLIFSAVMGLLYFPLLKGSGDKLSFPFMLIICFAVIVDVIYAAHCIIKRRNSIDRVKRLTKASVTCCFHIVFFLSCAYIILTFSTNAGVLIFNQ
ncbi:hypothetical protein NEFER03_1883 [Nematocida sp. LUAm3]|nr:hypothetical protein NEFER03_1883 [Nematocida sp. LUAm3]KAI5173966.1 hypothetical protein NEFER02_0433 [Nematocida sp. LUAm2]KAI5177289.1 hypothetical protein NEFER01_0564 [Nematocida sp. LUAm1]